jgi:hypothetical protein
VRVPLSVLDLAPIPHGGTATSSIAASVALARCAEEHGYERVWYAEHHNMPTIASSATSVLIAHVGVQTSRIRLGAGGIMLPNHSPLTIAPRRDGRGHGCGTLDAQRAALPQPAGPPSAVLLTRLRRSRPELQPRLAL